MVDGRWPIEAGTHYSAVAVQPIQAADAGAQRAQATPVTSVERSMDTNEITILTGWSEGIAETLAYAPERVWDLLEEARGTRPWRADFNLAPLSIRLTEAIAAAGRLLAEAAAASDSVSFDALLRTSQETQRDELPLERLARRVLRSTLEQLRTRQGQTGLDRG
jgi:hypothetical protein